MLSHRRVLALVLFGACAVAAALLPVVALAHGGHHRTLRWRGSPTRICAEVGVSLTGHAHGGRPGAPVGLTEAQVSALKAACEKLKPAYEKAQSSDSHASKTLQTELEAAGKKLRAVCPPPGWRHRHHHPYGATGPTGPTGPTGACKEARKTYHNEVKMAEQNYDKEREAAAKTLQPALTEFEAAVTGILGSPSMRHCRHQTGPSGPTGPTGPTGATGSVWGFTSVPGGQGHSSGRYGR